MPAFAPQHQQCPALPKEWHQERFGCCDDMNSCCLGAWCGCNMWAQTLDRARQLHCFLGTGTYLACIWGVYWVLSSIIYNTADRSNGGAVGGEAAGRLVAFGTFACIAVRHRYGLPFNGWFEEWCYWMWCGPCSMCQEYQTVMRNVDHQGQWILQHQQVMPQIMPQVVQGMPVHGGGHQPQFQMGSAPVHPAPDGVGFAPTK
jgi:Cys-rich protein (TIGR01571 family)